MKVFASLALVAATLAAPALAQDPAYGEKEVTIPFAGQGGLRNWTNGPAGSNIVYVQDRRLRWYRVELSGPCAEDGAASLTFQTDVTGSFDQFSRVGSLRSPERVCAVVSIRDSAPPPGQLGARPKPKSHH